MDWPSLGFGFYCAMHATASLPLEEDLPPQGQQEFHQYEAEDEAALEDELSKMVAAVEAAEMNLDDSPNVGGMSACAWSRLVRLQRENQQLRTDREIPPRGLVWFARESEPTKLASERADILKHSEGLSDGW